MGFCLELQEFFSEGFQVGGEGGLGWGARGEGLWEEVVVSLRLVCPVAERCMCECSSVLARVCGLRSSSLRCLAAGADVGCSWRSKIWRVVD